MIIKLAGIKLIIRKLQAFYVPAYYLIKLLQLQLKRSWDTPYSNFLKNLYSVAIISSARNTWTLTLKSTSSVYHLINLAKVSFSPNYFRSMSIKGKMKDARQRNSTVVLDMSAEVTASRTVSRSVFAFFLPRPPPAACAATPGSPSITSLHYFFSLFDTVFEFLTHECRGWLYFRFGCATDDCFMLL